MDDKELYKLARAGDPECIPGLLSMISHAALEILRLEGERDALKAKRYRLVNRTLADFMGTYRGYAKTKRV
jgi:hypothetical protein